MDFHSLTRKELQSLCKINKIPANMTNLAMADALATLQFVEGLDELGNQSQSPEKTAATESPLILRTAYRTSTRRKPIKEDPDTVQLMTRTRRTARKPLDKDLEQESHKVKDNMTKEMSCGVETETPVAQTGRRRVAQVGSTRRKLEEESVQRVYSTRRSVRLLEKTLADLSLKDVAKEDPVKMVALDETEEKNGSEVSLEKSNDSEISLDVSFLKSLDNESQLKEVKRNEHERDNCNVGTYDHVNSDNVSVVDGKDDNHDETCDTSNELLVKNSNAIKPADIPDIEFISKTENATSKVIEPEEPLAAEMSDEISAQMVETVVHEDQIITPQNNSKVDSDQFVANSIASPLKKQVAVECVVPVHQDNFVATYNSDSQNVKIDDEFKSDKVVATNCSTTNSNATPLKMQVAVECVEKESVHSDNVVATHGSDVAETEDEFELDNTTHSSHSAIAETEDEFDSDNAVDDPNSETDDEFDSDNVVTHSSDDSNDETDDEFDSDDELVHVQLTKAEVSMSSVEGPDDVNLIEAEVPTSDDLNTEGTEEAKFSHENRTPKSLNSSLPIDSISGDKTPGNHPMPPLEADSILGQFPPPTQWTPKQSSSMKKDTAKKLTLPANNKENIDSSVMLLESKTENLKNDKSMIDVDNLQNSLSKKSLRKLSKMLKEKLQITNKKNNEDHNATNTRPALLENAIAPADPNKEN